MTDDRDPRRIPFRAMIPNAITALALCLGLTGVSLAIGGQWEKALGAIVLAGVLDGLDGRIARLLRAQSRFGAELDSLSDNIASGAGAVSVVLESRAEVRLDCRAGTRCVLRAEAGAIQCPTGRGRAAAQGRGLQYWRTGARRRGPGVHSSLSVVDHV
jgi:hypothetical protein